MKRKSIAAGKERFSEDQRQRICRMIDGRAELKVGLSRTGKLAVMGVCVPYWASGMSCG